MNSMDKDDEPSNTVNVLGYDSQKENANEHESTPKESLVMDSLSRENIDDGALLTTCDSLMEVDRQKPPLENIDITKTDINLDGILELVDEIESQVEQFRQKVKMLEEEKRSLQSTVNFLSQMLDTNQSKHQNGSIESSMTSADSMNDGSKIEERRQDKIENAGLSKIDCEEVKASLDRINKRIGAVHVRIVTTRDEDQIKSLEKINVIISQLLNEIDLACDDPEVSISTENELCNSTTPSSRFDNVLLKVKMYFNSCNTSNESTERGEKEKITDTKFESLLLACTSDDQKKIKNRLSSIIDQIHEMSGKDS